MNRCEHCQHFASDECIEWAYIDDQIPCPEFELNFDTLLDVQKKNIQLWLMDYHRKGNQDE